jgi:hypothetical protein
MKLGPFVDQSVICCFRPIRVETFQADNHGTLTRVCLAKSLVTLRDLLLLLLYNVAVVCQVSSSNKPFIHGSLVEIIESTLESTS